MYYFPACNASRAPASGPFVGLVMARPNVLHIYKYIKYPLVMRVIPVCGLKNYGCAYGASANNLNVRLNLDRARTWA